MTEALFENLAVAIVGLWDGIGRLVEVVYVYLNIFYLIIDLLELVHHLVEILVQHLLIVVVCVILVFLFLK